MTLVNAPTYVFECFEAGCDAALQGEGEDALIAVVNAHMRAVHDTFELEDVIVANAYLRRDDRS